MLMGPPWARAGRCLSSQSLKEKGNITFMVFRWNGGSRKTSSAPHRRTGSVHGLVTFCLDFLLIYKSSPQFRCFFIRAKESVSFPQCATRAEHFSRRFLRISVRISQHISLSDTCFSTLNYKRGSSLGSGLPVLHCLDAINLKINQQYETWNRDVTLKTGWWTTAHSLMTGTSWVPRSSQ